VLRYQALPVFHGNLSGGRYDAGMVRREEIDAYVRALARTFRPERVLLFGSYARGTPQEDSDVDMLVVMDHDKKKDVEQAVTIDVELRRDFPLDLIVRRPSEVKRRLAMGDGFLSAIMGEGRVLYERHP
jgi:predicted nucleotidyltransferase